MHAHFSKPVNAFDPEEVEYGLQFQSKPQPPHGGAPLIAAAGVSRGRCERI